MTLQFARYASLMGLLCGINRLFLQEPPKKGNIPAEKDLIPGEGYRWLM
jgi:hypothetical protein